MAYRARQIGRRETPIRFGNPSKRISSGMSPVTMHNYHADQVWFEGKLEQELLVQQAVRDDTVAIEQDVPPIEWSDGSKWFTYRPRFCVRRKNGTTALIEVSWAAKASRLGLREVLGLIEPFARAAGYSCIEFYTDVQIRKPARLANSYLLRRAASHPPDIALLERIADRADEAGAPVEGALLIAGLADGPSALLAVARLIFEGVLKPVDTSARITLDAEFVTTTTRKGSSHGQ
jgi:hypothetical protein